MLRRKPRIFIGFIEIAGYFNNLSRGFKSLGIDCAFYDLHGHRFNYRTDRVSFLVRLHQYCANKLFEKKHPTILWKLISLNIKILLFFWALIKYDVFIFGFGSSFYRYKELPILKIFGKTIIHVFLGTDARPSFISGNVVIQQVMKQEGGFDFDLLYEDTVQRKKRIARIEKYADYIVNHPPTAHFQSRKFISFMRMGFPFDIQTDLATADPSSPGSNGIVRIVHAPSFAEAKGTKVIRQYIKNLRNKGYKIDFIEIINRPHSEVLTVLSQCDFVIDELYSDIPLGGLGTEAAFYSKPTVNGGYYSGMIKDNYPPEAIPPALYCMPQEMEGAIERLIVDEVFRNKLGKEAKQFVETRWSVQDVAKRYLQMIEGNAPDDWFFNPYDIHYIHGYGLSEEKLRLILRGFIEKYGPEALQISDKPDLLKKFVQFSQTLNQCVK